MVAALAKEFDEIIANNGLVLGMYGGRFKDMDLPTGEAYTALINNGLEGTHLSGNITVFSQGQGNALPFEATVDLETMVVTKAKYIPTESDL